MQRARLVCWYAAASCLLALTLLLLTLTARIATDDGRWLGRAVHTVLTADGKDHRSPYQWADQQIKQLQERALRDDAHLLKKLLRHAIGSKEKLLVTGLNHIMKHRRQALIRISRAVLRPGRLSDRMIDRVLRKNNEQLALLLRRAIGLNPLQSIATSPASPSPSSPDTSHTTRTPPPQPRAVATTQPAPTPPDSRDAPRVHALWKALMTTPQQPPTSRPTTP